MHRPVHRGGVGGAEGRGDLAARAPEAGGAVRVGLEAGRGGGAQLGRHAADGVDGLHRGHRGLPVRLQIV